MRRLALALAAVTVASFTGMGQGKFSGYMFGDYFYNVARDTAFAKLPAAASQGGSKSFQGFQIRRIYFAYDNDISEQFTTRFRLEGAFLASEGSTAGAQQLFIKDAYLRLKNVFS